MGKSFRYKDEQNYNIKRNKKSKKIKRQNLKKNLRERNFEKFEDVEKFKNY